MTVDDATMHEIEALNTLIGEAEKLILRAPEIEEVTYAPHVGATVEVRLKLHGDAPGLYVKQNNEPIWLPWHRASLASRTALAQLLEVVVLRAKKAYEEQYAELRRASSSLGWTVKKLREGTL